eukprot:gene17543-23864_t
MFAPTYNPSPTWGAFGHVSDGVGTHARHAGRQWHVCSRSNASSGIDVQHGREMDGGRQRRVCCLAKTRYTIDDDVCPPPDPLALQLLVEKHIQTLPRFIEAKPVASHTKEAFAAVLRQHSGGNGGKVGGVILDSGCGTAGSSILLGSMYPHHVVIGVDRSLARLSRNVIFRASQAGSGAGSPKRRSSSDIHGDTCSSSSSKTGGGLASVNDDSESGSEAIARAFPLGGDIILRSNWQGYLQQFADATLAAEKALLRLDSEQHKLKPADGSSSKKRCNSVNEGIAQQNPEGSSCSSSTGDSRVCTTGMLRHAYVAKYRPAAMRGPTQVSTCVQVLALTNFEEKYLAVEEPVYELSLLMQDTTS